MAESIASLTLDTSLESTGLVRFDKKTREGFEKLGLATVPVDESSAVEDDDFAVIRSETVAGRADCQHRDRKYQPMNAESWSTHAASPISHSHKSPVLLTTSSPTHSAGRTTGADNSLDGKPQDAVVTALQEELGTGLEVDIG